MSKSRAHARLLCAVSMIGFASLGLVAEAQAQATPDAIGDFIPSYTGPKNGDLDITSTQATYNGSNIRLDATLNGAVGQTQGGVYVWGFNRGQGTARFGSIATGVLFDSVLIIDPHGTTTLRDLISGTATVLPAGAVVINGNKLSVTLPASLLTSEGFKTAQYLVNLWPRSGLVGNQTIADFGPDNSDEKLVLDFPRPIEASVETELVFDGASARFNQILGRLAERRSSSDQRISGFLQGGARFGDRGLGDSDERHSADGSIAGGIDVVVTPNLTVGAGFAYDDQSADVTNGGKIKASTYSPTLYGEWRAGQVHIDAYAAYSAVHYDSRRILPIGNQSFVATASPDGNAYTIGASGGYDFHAGRLTYGPVADVLATKAHVGGYVENESNDFGSTLQSRDRTSVRLGLGLQGEYALRDISWGALSLTGSGKVVQELGDRRDRFQYAFTVDPTTTFQAQGPNTGVTYGAFDLGMTLAAKDGLRVAVSYSPRFDGRGFVDQGASLSIRKTF